MNKWDLLFIIYWLFVKFTLLFLMWLIMKSKSSYVDNYTNVSDFCLAILINSNQSEWNRVVKLLK